MPTAAPPIMMSSILPPLISYKGPNTLFRSFPTRNQPRARGTPIRPRVQALFNDEHYAIDLSDIINVVRRLAALRILFPLLQEEAGMPHIFDLNAPLQRINIGKAGIARLLRRSLPTLPLPAGTATNRLVDGLWNIVHDAGERNRRKFIRTDFATIAIDPHSVPSVWPAQDMQAALLAGDWDQVDLTGAALAGADLRGVNWQGAVLHRANLRAANLTGATLEAADFSYADLSDAKLHKASLDRSLLRHANMNRASATGASFRNAMFEGANLDNVDFCRAHLDDAVGLACGQGTDFTGTKLDRAEVTVKKNIDNLGSDTTMLSPWQLCSRRETRNRQLTALLTINHRYNTSFLAAVGVLIDLSVNDGCNFLTGHFFTSDLLPQQRCWHDPKIRAFIHDALLLPLLARWNTESRCAEEPSHALVTEFLRDTGLTLEMSRYSGAISQLIFSDATVNLQPDIPRDLTSRQKALQQRFLAAPEIAPVVNAMEEIEQGLAPLCHIYMSLDGMRALAYEDTVLQKMVLGLASPCDGYLFERGDNGIFFNQNLHDPSDALCPQTLPAVLKEMQLAPIACRAVIGHILDGSPNRDRFLAALRQRTLPAPAEDRHGQRVPLGDDIALVAHFKDFYDGSRNDHSFLVKMAHVNRLTEIIADNDSWVKHTPSDQARIMACIGVLFVRYSAQPVFGTEYDSHICLRDYARACLNRSHALDPALMPECVTEMRHTLLGTDSHAQCTAQLATRLFLQLKMHATYDHRLAMIIDTLYPTAWL